MMTEGRRSGFITEFIGKMVYIYQGNDDPIGPDLDGPVEILDVDGEWLKVRNSRGKVVYFAGRRAAGIVPVDGDDR
jgi:hypothetical protein